jgi:hypothetical protein
LYSNGYVAFLRKSHALSIFIDVSEDLVKKRRRGERGRDVDVLWSGGGEGRKGRHG